MAKELLCLVFKCRRMRSEGHDHCHAKLRAFVAKAESDAVCCWRQRKKISYCQILQQSGLFYFVYVFKKMQFLAQRKESILITEINELMLISGTNPARSENRICEYPGGSGGFE